MVQPKINFNIQSNFKLGGSIPFASASLIGTASWGEEGVVKEYDSFSDIKNHFKTGTIVDGAEKFFATGGRSIQTVRIVDGVNEAEATATYQNTAVDVLTITSLYSGATGNSTVVTITANAGTPANRDIKITDGITLENYTNLATNDAIVAAINATSILVTSVVVGANGTSNIVDASTAAVLAGGNDGITGLTSAEYTSALTDKLWLKNWDYLLIPGQTTDALHSSISILLDTRATEENKYSIYVTGVDKFEAIATTIARTSINSNGNLVVVHSALYIGDDTPSIDSTSANYLDGSYTACSYAGLLCKLPVNYSPTFKSLGVYGVKINTDVDYTSAERESLLSLGFTIITTTLNDDIGSYQAVTRNGDNTSWQFMLDNVRKVHYMTDNIYEVVKNYIGHPNSGSTRTSIGSSISNFLKSTVDGDITSGYNIEVNAGTDPRAVIVSVDVLLINELNYIDINLILNI